ncbi:MmgE/PrpD family protein [Corynebacterium sp. A21]|uniref:MmgE/PrpD family protein n=1 Tax=Corynebacterium sp. A21 TaxID=3457318 RepID=UPI003FD2F721
MIARAEQQQLETSLNELVERCRNLGRNDLSSRAVETARHSLLDWLGCAIAGANEPAAQRFLSVLDPATGDSPVIGTAQGLHWRDAMMVNAFNGHLLDFDDMLPSYSGHPSAVILPAVLGVGFDEGSSISEIITALVIGTEAGDWVARQVMPGHYDSGWHATGTIGTFAAAAAISYLRGLDHVQWISALDTAATQSAGLKAMFGTLAKPLHAGNASQAGAMAAGLAEISESSGRAVIGDFGFISNYRGETGPSNVPSHFEFAIEGMLYKTYASCFMTQASVDIGHQARAELGSLEGASIELIASPKLADVCAIEDPQTPHDAKFSLHATFALAALGHDLSTEKSFSTPNLQDKQYRELRKRIHLNFDPALIGNETRIQVNIRFPDGREWIASIDRGEPASDLNSRGETLTAKFRQLALPHLGTVQTALVTDLALQGSEQLVSELINYTRITDTIPSKENQSHG